MTGKTSGPESTKKLALSNAPCDMPHCCGKALEAVPVEASAQAEKRQDGEDDDDQPDDVNDVVHEISFHELGRRPVYRGDSRDAKNHLTCNDRRNLCASAHKAVLEQS